MVVKVEIPKRSEQTIFYSSVRHTATVYIHRLQRLCDYTQVHQIATRLDTMMTYGGRDGSRPHTECHRVFNIRSRSNIY